MTATPLDRVITALRDAGLLVSIEGELPDSVYGLTDDSRTVKVESGSCFVAVRGAVQDGHVWLNDAQSKGAVMAIVENANSTQLPRIVVRDGRRAAAVAAAAWYNWPARQLKIVGVTGTNGKTTTVSILRHLLECGGLSAASIGTLGVLVGSNGTELPLGSGLTTPGPVALQHILSQLVQRGIKAVAMEVSSHALDQRRVESVTFAAAVFTNLTRDHLDYHGSMDSYLSSKLRLAALLAREGSAVVNGDDSAWHSVVAPSVVTFGTAAPANVMARDVTYGPEGCTFTLVTPQGATKVSVPLIGEFNVSNILGAAAAALTQGVALASVAAALKNVPQVPGRLERISDSPVVLRDYAHTPDALDRALRAVRPFANDGRLSIVFGCGGDRDRGKRPEMGRIAETLADNVIITSDNPRTENPDSILDDIESGMTLPHTRIVDREEAIRYALSMAGDKDVILLAGKGHETYQIRGTTSYPFDEREIVSALIASNRIST